MIKNTDEELLALIKKKNSNAFKVLFERYESGIYNYILRYSGDRGLAQELLQETFTRVWFSAHLYAPDRGKVKNWLFTIALNITRNEMVKKRYIYRYEDITMLNDSKNEPDSSKSERPDLLLEHQDLKTTIAKALGNLKPELREVILLKHFQQLKFREIAEITKIAEGTIKARFRKAISELKKHLKPIDQ
ncbi:sigma-70 family RNA polymerase sigma factor [Fulvivirgaceae bacterium BMA10]|uniref:Sigma-70 family RNA polymerase sigma factor n=1 Tax=Splendidivirga corallicola TaxID=3051826 RepID=A0ABT8KHT0_9BACT|nr:sigma-70 family RNA polymerase sigma factor [Fulvivirgaceae bacterium BMA10]